MRVSPKRAEAPDEIFNFIKMEGSSLHFKLHDFELLAGHHTVFLNSGTEGTFSSLELH
jgi:hypothetical protein